MKDNVLKTWFIRGSRPILAPLGNYLDRLGLSLYAERTWADINLAIKSPKQKQLKFLMDYDQWIRDGSNLLAATREMKSAASRKKQTKSFQYRAASAIETALVKGESISEGMKGLFSKELISLYKIGEETNSITELFADYVEQDQKRTEVFKSGKSKLLQPASLLLLIISILVAANDYGVPMALDYGLNIERLTGMPGKTLVLAQWTSSIWSWASWMLLALFAIYFVSRDYYSKKIGGLPSRETLDKFFPYSVHKEFTAMTIVQRIALLSKIGMPVGTTVKTLMKTATPYELKYYKRIIQKTATETGTIADYLDIGLLNDDVYQRLRGVANQEGSEAKVRAIVAASRESGESGRVSLKRMLLGVQISLWGLVAVLGGITGLGLVTLTFQMKQLININ